tara:strand:+ start:522 stop:758 length:237 start_codon:yes stop_codon:yes gene_type:complete
MNLQDLSSQLIDKFTTEVKKKENLNKIQQSLLDPLIKYTIQCIYPYIITISVIFILTFILAIAIFILIIKDRLPDLRH